MRQLQIAVGMPLFYRIYATHSTHNKIFTARKTEYFKIIHYAASI